MSTKLNNFEDRNVRLEDENQALKMKNKEMDNNLRMTTKNLNDLTSQREKDISNMKIIEKENSNYKYMCENMKEEIHSLKTQLDEDNNFKLPQLEKTIENNKNEFSILKERLNTSERRASVIPE